MRWTKKGHEFDEIAAKICDNTHEYVIWGAGTFGWAFYDEFKDEINITAFVDSNEKKWGNDRGILIDSPSALQHSDGKIVIVSTGWTNQVFSALEEKGYKRYVNYFHIDEFLTIYMMYKKNKLVASFCGLDITEFCSLRCKKCLEFNPYIENKIHSTVEDVDCQLSLYFKWVDEVNVLALSGGDSMVNPMFEDILESIGRKYYGKEIHHIEVYSNAIVIPSRLCLELLKKYDVIYRFTDYGERVEKKQKISQIVQMLEEREIKYDWAKFDKWVDMGYPQENNGISVEKLVQFYTGCDRRSCQRIKGKRFFYCGSASNAERAGYCKADARDYYDLTQPEINKKEFMEFMLGYNERGYIEYCKKCNGSLNINNHFIVPGEQLE